MKLLQALINRIRGFLNLSAKKISDPVIDSQLVIEDSKDYLAELRSKIVTIMAKEKELTRKSEELSLEVTKYATLAEKAAKEGKVDIARDALTRQISLEQELATTRKTAAILTTQVGNLRTKLKEAEDKVTGAENKQSVLTAQRASLQVTKDIAAITNEFIDSDSPLSRLNDFDNAIQAEQDELEAAIELGSSSNALAEYEKSVGNGEVDARLANLLAKK